MTQADTQTRAIDVEFDLPQAPATVWRALTDSALIARWLMANDFQPVVGHRFTMQAQPVPGWDGTVHCEVLAVEPPTRLSYTWRGGSDNLQGYGHTLDTTLTWTLTPTPDGGTHVRMVHDGFRAEDAFAYEAMGQGWRSNIAGALGRLAAEIA